MQNMAIHRCCSLISILLSLAFLPLPLLAQADLPTIESDKKHWNVLLLSTEKKKNIEISSSIVAKISIELAQLIQKLDKHSLDQTETTSLRHIAIQKRRYQYNQNLNQTMTDYDRKVFSSTESVNTLIKQRESKRKEHSERMTALIDYDIQSILIPTSLAIKFFDHSNRSFQLPNLALREQDYDLIIWTKLNHHHQVNIIEIWTLFAHSNKKIQIWKGLIDQNNYTTVIDNMKRKLTAAILGRPWASLEITSQTVNQSNAMIYLDGRLQGENLVSLHGLHPDRVYEIEVIGEGVEGKISTVQLKAGESKQMRIDLDTKTVSRKIQVSTSTPAKAYLGVRYVGNTPLQINIPHYKSLLVLEAEDMDPINYILNPDHKQDLVFTMNKSQEANFAERYQYRKTRFFWSSGLFLTSLAVPLLSAGFMGTNNKLAEYNQQDRNLVTKYQDRAHQSLVTLFIGSAVSIGLLGLNIYDLIRYSNSTKALASIS